MSLERSSHFVVKYLLFELLLLLFIKPFRRGYLTPPQKNKKSLIKKIFGALRAHF